MSIKTSRFISPVTALVGLIVASNASAQAPIPTCDANGTGCVTSGLQQAGNQAGFSLSGTAPSVTAIVAGAINAILGLSGVAFLVLLVWSGVLYFISQGDPEKIKKAKATIIWSSAGLVVVVAAYAMSNFLFSTLLPIATKTG